MRNFLLFAFCASLPAFAGAQHWAHMGNGVTENNINAMYTDTNDKVIYLGGSFIKAGNVNARGIAKWDGIQWDSLGTGMDVGLGNIPNNVFSICRYQNYIYAGGAFTTAGGIYSPDIARWNGTNWEAVSGVNGTVDAMHIYNNELYVCGTFDSIGGMRANGIAKWDGATWQNVYNFPDNTGFWPFNEVNDMIFYNGQLYLCGIFNDSSGHDEEIARYNGNSWDYFSFPGTFTIMETMTVYQGYLYVAGIFYKSQGEAGNNIMNWDGMQWSDVGDGTGGIVSNISRIKIHNAKLYACGPFTTAGNIPAQYIAIWDEEKWCGLGSTFDQGIEDFDFLNDTLYIAGGFDTIDGGIYDGVAKWIGGNYIDTCSVIFSGVNNVSVQQAPLQIYPNPSSGAFSLTIPSLYRNSRQIKISNILGEVVYNNNESNADLPLKINLPYVSSGIYFINVSDGQNVYSGKLVVQK